MPTDLSHPAEGDTLVERLRTDLGDMVTAREAADRLEALSTENARLMAGLKAFVNCQSPLTRAQMREAAEDILGGRAGSWPDQSPFVARASAADAEAARVKEALPPELREIKPENAVRCLVMGERSMREGYYRLAEHLRSALAYLDADADLEDPDHEVSRVEAVDLRTGETRVLDAAAARAALSKEDGHER